jgi:hypothetical protein
MKKDDIVKLLTLYNKGMIIYHMVLRIHKKVIKEIDELREKQPHLESVQKV